MCSLSLLATNPIYAMLTTKLPISVCQKLDKLNKDFLWGSCVTTKKIHLTNWQMCRPKDYDGLGIKSTLQMNEGMPAKTSWRLFQKDEGLWSNVLQKKYLKSWSIVDPLYSSHARCSSLWC